MKRFLLVLAVIAPLGTGACNKPTPEDCRKAISNMERLLGTEATARLADNEGEVRRCRGGSSKEAVDCAIKATTLEELKACTFMSSKGKPAPSPSAPSPSAPPPSAPTTTTTPPPGAPPPNATPPNAPPPSPGAAPSTPPPSTK